MGHPKNSINILSEENKKIMKIELFKNTDLDEIVELWYETSIKTHNFIPVGYWRTNKEVMKTEYLPNSETYLAIKTGKIIGFISMKRDYLAGLFVKNDVQGEGVGTQLLDYIKQRQDVIRLNVYKKNTGAVRFYEKRDFKLVSENIDEKTGESEYLMEWHK